MGCAEGGPSGQFAVHVPQRLSQKNTAHPQVISRPTRSRNPLRPVTPDRRTVNIGKARNQLGLHRTTKGAGNAVRKKRALQAEKAVSQRLVIRADAPAPVALPRSPSSPSRWLREFLQQPSRPHAVPYQEPAGRTDSNCSEGVVIEKRPSGKTQ